MDLRRERKRTNRVIGILLMLIIACIGAISAVWFTRASQPVVNLDFPTVEEQDTRAADLELTAKKLRTKQNPANQFSYRINKTPQFESGTAEGNIQIENPIENLYLMAVELVRDDTGEVIFRSGYLKPNQILESSALDEPLPAGEYAVTACICAIDFESYDLLGILEQSITVTVLK